MGRKVKGILFADYVRMIRSHKSVVWKDVLTAEDLPYLEEKIEPEKWYPMEVFERLGNAILEHNAGGNLASVRLWGRFSVDFLRDANPTLIAAGDPVESLNRFRVLRATYFDFEAITVTTLIDGQARIVISYYMGAKAEEAASMQAMGFFERLVEVAGGSDVSAQFLERSWAGDPRTLLEVTWKPG